MTGQPKKYQRQKHINAVMKKSGAKYSVQAILMAMCSRSEFDAPTVTITKAEIFFLIGGLHRRYIMGGLRQLEADGVIEVIKNGQGGHGIAPTYLLKVRRDGKEAKIEEYGAEAAPGRVRVTKEAAQDILKKAGFRV